MIELHYWVDVFTPKPFTQYDQNNEIFLVIIPCFLFDEENPVNPGLIVDYLKSFHNSESQEFKFIPLALNDDDDDDDIENLEIVPVPFHPAVEIKKSGTRINYEKNETGYRFSEDDINEKIDFIINNYGSVPLYILPPTPEYPVDDYRFLSEDQRVQVSEWLKAVFKEPKEEFENIARKVLDKKEGKYLPKLNEELAKESKKNFPEPTPITNNLIKLLQKEERRYFDNLRPPGFKFSLEMLQLIKKENEEGLRLRLGTEFNYNKIVAGGLLEIYENTKNDSVEEDEDIQLVKQLKLFYGAGERLRINTLRNSDVFNIMNITDDFKEKEISIVTNNYSLLGHVIGLPLQDSLVNPFENLSVQINNREIFDGSTGSNELKEQIKAACHNALNNNSKTFKREIKLGLPDELQDIEIRDKIRKGKAHYYPVNAMGVALKELSLLYNQANKDEKEKREIFSVPEMIFDELEERPRVEYKYIPAPEDASSLTEDTVNFVNFPVQRKFVSFDEIWQNENHKELAFPEAATYFPGLQIKVSVRKIKLANDKLIYKISKDFNGYSSASDWETFKKVIDQVIPEKPDTDLAIREVDFEKYHCFLIIEGGENKDGVEMSKKMYRTNQFIGPKWNQDMSFDMFMKNDSNDLSEQISISAPKEAQFLLLKKAYIEKEPESAIYKCFNLLLSATDVKSPFIALKSRFKFKFGISVNGFSTNLFTNLYLNEFTKSEETRKIWVEPTVIDYSNFNKFRIFLSINDNDRIDINEADALLPEYELISDIPLNFKFIYPIMHRFSESTQNIGTRAESKDPEEKRYLLYKNAGKEWQLNGYMENQYGYRLSVQQDSGDSKLKFGYSGPIRHIGTLSAPSVERKKDIPAIYFKFEEGGQTSRISIKINTDYINYIIKKGNLADFRSFYEAVFDLLNNKATLVIEGWNFDNALNTIKSEVSSHPEKSNKFPTIIDNLKKNNLESETLAISLNEDFLNEHFNNEHVKTFRGFKDNIENLQGDVTLFKYERPRLTSDIVRVGLLIERKSCYTVFNQFETILNDNEALEKELSPTPYRSDHAAGSSENTTDSIFKSAKAVDNLREYLDSNVEANNLYRSFSYIVSDQCNSGFDGEYVEKILGETARFVHLPESGEQKTQATTYYVPYSFKPLKLAGWEGTVLKTEKDRYDFLLYLIQILAWLAYPEKQKGKIEDLIHLEWVKEDPLISLKVRNRTRKQWLISEGTIAEAMSKLLIHTDNDISIKDESLHNEVKKSRDAIYKSLKSAFKSIFIADPLKFIELKAIGVGLFNLLEKNEETDKRKKPNQGFEDLYSFKLEKKITDNQDTTSTNDGQSSKSHKVETSHFNFQNLLDNTDHNVSFYIDLLTDELYDNEFTISKKANEGIEGRTAEDILENRLHYGKKEKVNEKKVQLSVEPYCKSWGDYYFLPSRMPPTLPLPISLNKDEDKKMMDFEFDKGIKKWGEKLTEILKKQYDLKESKSKDEIEFISFSNPFYLIEENNLQLQEFRLDSYINQYCFLLNPDEENEISNDIFEIEIEKVAKKEIEDSIATSSVKSVSEQSQQNLIKGLEQQFIKNVKKEDITDTEEIDIDDMTDNEAGLKSVILNLLTPQNIEELDSPSNSSYVIGKIEKNWKIKKRGGKVEEQPDKSLEVGDIIAANILREKGEGKGKRFLLRIFVLTNPWSHHRCRVRVRRNVRFVDKDTVSDINPVFQMNTEFSVWADYGIQSISYNYLKDDNARNWPTELKYIVLSDEQISSFRKNRNMGNIISQLLKKKSLSSKESLFSKEILDYNIRVLVSNRPGYNFMPVFHDKKSSKEIKEWKAKYSDKIDFIEGSYWKDIPRDNPNLRYHDLIVNPLDDSVLGLSPFIKMMWYSEESGERPVFSINWQLKLFNNN